MRGPWDCWAIAGDVESADAAQRTKNVMALQRRIGTITMRPRVGNGNGSIVAVTEVIGEACGWVPDAKQVK